MSSEDQPITTLKKRLLSIPTLASCSIAITFLIFLVVRFDVDFKATWGYYTDSNKCLLAVAFLLHYTTFLLRGARWRLLLCAAQEHDHKIPGTIYFSMLILIGWFVNSITWFRLGDAYRSYLFACDTNRSFSLTMGTVLTERALDTLLVFTLVSIATIYVITNDIDANWFLLGIAGSALFSMAIIMSLLSRFHSVAISLLPKGLSQVYARFRFGVLRSFRQAPRATALTMVTWSCEIGRLFLVVHALGFSVSIPTAIFAIVTNGVLTLVPITPGGIGIVESGMIGVLGLTLSKNAAVSVAILDRAISWLSVILIGALTLMVKEILQRRKPAKSESLPTT